MFVASLDSTSFLHFLLKLQFSFSPGLLLHCSGLHVNRKNKNCFRLCQFILSYFFGYFKQVWMFHAGYGQHMLSKHIGHWDLTLPAVQCHPVVVRAPVPAPAPVCSARWHSPLHAYISDPGKLHPLLAKRHMVRKAWAMARMCSCILQCCPNVGGERGGLDLISTRNYETDAKFPFF